MDSIRFIEKFYHIEVHMISDNSEICCIYTELFFVLVLGKGPLQCADIVGNMGNCSLCGSRITVADFPQFRLGCFTLSLFCCCLLHRGFCQLRCSLSSLLCSQAFGALLACCAQCLLLRCTGRDFGSLLRCMGGSTPSCSFEQLLVALERSDFALTTMSFVLLVCSFGFGLFSLGLVLACPC